MPALALWLLSGGPLLFAGPPETTLAGPTPTAEIVGGMEVTGTEHVETVYLRLGNVACTGTLIDERLVITAAHCLAGAPDLDRICVLLGDEVVPQACWGSSGKADALTYGISPDYCPDCERDANDIGYVWLDQRVTGIDYPKVITSQGEYEDMMHEGAKVEFVGYGSDESGASDGKKREVTATITDFVAKGREFFAGGDGKDTCSGDSGGPAFMRASDGSLRLVGVTSRGFPECGKGGLYTAPFENLCWIRDETGVDLLPEGCEGCDCVNLNETGDGCGCAADPQSPPWAALLLFACFGWRRRQRITYPRT